MVWGVAALVHAVADALSARFSACTIRGEISGFSRASSGHCYLSLKDADGASALIRCAMFRRAASLLDFSPADGQLVEVRGRLGVYEPRGELQFVVESMQRAGAGALFEKFLRLKAKLEAEGLFDAEHKRALPLYPRRVGVVTSLGAAALHDVLTAMARRAPHVEVVLYPSLVQGSEAPAQLVAAIELASRRAEVDVLIVCRGGGSLEDLWAFNDERVVRAIVGCSVPVLCGVGHETDITLSDFAADLRAPTPTAAAEMVSPTRGECLALLDAWAEAMSRRVGRVLDEHAQRLDRAGLRLQKPAQALSSHARLLASLQQRMSASALAGVRRQERRSLDAAAALQRAVHAGLGARHRRLASAEGHLRGMDPRQVLSRGYAWVTDERGRALTSAQSIAPGQGIVAVLADGHARARVEEVVRRSPEPE
jgi:exodeoxyribonuclease VII large subunit